MTGIWRIRAAVLTLLGALAVHHGRYAVAEPHHGGEYAAAHAYLNWLAPAIAVALFLATLELGVRLARPGRPARERELPGARAMWAVATASLLTVFIGQETLESFFAHGHLPALGEILAAGGWTAIPLAMLAGAGVAVLLRGVAAAVRWAAVRSLRRPSRRRPPLAFPVAPVLAAPRSVLARRLAGRAPPAGALS